MSGDDQDGSADADAEADAAAAADADTDVGAGPAADAGVGASVSADAAADATVESVAGVDAVAEAETGADVMIRPAAVRDWPGIWDAMEPVFRAGETYTFPRDIREADARAAWMELPGARVLVAVDAHDRVLGTAKYLPNQPGAGSHVANASFVVGQAGRGLRLGERLGRAVLDAARADGFRAMQFNAVVETNTRAVRLWRSLGFEIVGTVPEAFDHPVDGLVGLHVMYRLL